METTRTLNNFVIKILLLLNMDNVYIFKIIYYNSFMYISSKHCSASIPFIHQYECSSRRQNVHFQSYTHVFAIIVTINLNIFLKINIHVQCVYIYETKDCFKLKDAFSIQSNIQSSLFSIG